MTLHLLTGGHQLIVILASTLLLFLVNPVSTLMVVADDTFYDFESDLQGWHPTDLLQFSGNLEHVSTGGNPDGFMQVTDLAGGGGLFAQAPAELSGDLSGYGGISWDEFVFNNSANVTSRTAILIIGGDTAYNSGFFDTPTQIEVWTDRFVSFQTSEWTLESSPSIFTGTSPFNDVIKSVDALLISMDTSVSVGNRESGIDNVRLKAIPEPSFLGLMYCTLLFTGYRHSRVAD